MLSSSIVAEPNIMPLSPTLSDLQQTQLRRLIEKGIPVAEKPYELLAEQIGAATEQVIAQIKSWQDSGLIKRFGLVVKHRQLGYTANAMVVWDIPSHQVENIANKLASAKAVSLCYRRPRRLPHWTYNLFCMIHGKDRATVLAQIDDIVRQFDLGHIKRHVLFSTKAFKQQGARYGSNQKTGG